MMYEDTLDRQDTPYGRIWAAIEDHTRPGIYRERLRVALRVATGDLPASVDRSAVTALNLFLLSLNTPDGRAALRGFWGLWNATRKAA